MSGAEKAGEVSVRQWRLTHIQLVNWGTFCGYQHLVLTDRTGSPAQVAMITGESGTGKSTLFDAKTAVLMRSTARFNTASNQTTGRARGSRERNLYSYVMGKQDDEYDSVTGEARASYLRPLATANWSALFLTFASTQGETFCAGRLYYVTAHATGVPDTWYLTAEEELDPRAMDGRAHAKFTKATIHDAFPAARTHESQETFLRAVWRQLGIGRDGEGDSAMKLQERIQAGTTITDVDALFKDLVIDEPSTYEKAREAVVAFHEYEATWEEMDKARSKSERLAPIRGLHDQIKSLTDEIALLESCRPGQDGALALLLARRGEEVFTTLGQECEACLADLERQIDEREQEFQAREADLERVREEVAGRGGDVIDRLRADEEAERRHVRDINQTRERLKGYLGDIGRGLPQDEEAFEALVHEADEFLDGFEEARDALEERRLEASMSKKTLEEQRRELSEQLAFYRKHPSNITPRMARDRAQISQATGIPERELPYGAELMDIPEEEQEWRVAANVGFHGVASLLLVDRNRIDDFSVSLNSLHLNHRVSYQGVRLRGFRPGRQDVNKLSSKVVFREDSPFAAWVSEWVHDSGHDYICVEDPKELGGWGQRITREGQTRHRERGAHGFAQDSLIIGFSSRDRIARIERELKEVEATLQATVAELENIKGRLGALMRRRDAALQVVPLSWEMLDVTTHEQLLADIRAKIERLESDTELSELMALRDCMVREQRQLDQRLGALRDTHAQEELRAGAAGERLRQYGQERERLLQAGVSVSDVQAVALRYYLERAEQPYLSEESVALLADRHANNTVPASIIRAIRVRITTATNTCAEYVAQIEQVFQHYKKDFLDYDDPIGVGLASYPDYLRILEGLEAERLDLNIDDWLVETLRRAGAALAPLARAYTTDRREIMRRMEPINAIMSAFKFGPDAGCLEISVAERSPKAIRDFRQELQGWAQLATKSSFEDAEHLHRSLRDFMKRLEEATERQSRGVLNTKSLVYITVVAHYPDREDLPDKAYSSLGAKSGGETQELIAFILGAALLFCLGDNGAAVPSFAPVFLDEAFIKADERFTRRAIEALVGLGFQVVIAVPTSKVQAVEPVADEYICMTKDPVSNHSFISEMRGERDDAQDA